MRKYRLNIFLLRKNTSHFSSIISELSTWSYTSCLPFCLNTWPCFFFFPPTPCHLHSSSNNVVGKKSNIHKGAAQSILQFSALCIILHSGLQWRRKLSQLPWCKVGLTLKTPVYCKATIRDKHPLEQNPQQSCSHRCKPRCRLHSERSWFWNQTFRRSGYRANLKYTYSWI